MWGGSVNIGESRVCNILFSLFERTFRKFQPHHSFAITFLFFILVNAYKHLLHTSALNKVVEILPQRLSNHPVTCGDRRWAACRRSGCRDDLSLCSRVGDTYDGRRTASSGIASHTCPITCRVKSRRVHGVILKMIWIRAHGTWICGPGWTLLKKIKPKFSNLSWVSL